MASNYEYTVLTQNSYDPLFGEMAGDGDGDGFSNAMKRKRKNTGQSDTGQSDTFLSSSTHDKLSMMYSEIMCIRRSQEEKNRGMSTFQNCFKFMYDKLDEVVKVTNRNTSMMKTLAYKSIDLEARSRRNNLVFWGISENYNENCFSIIREFIKNHLDMDADKMYLARSHRLGPRKIGYRNPRRPIIVNFRDFCDTEAIMAKAYMLKGTPFSIDHDLPKEIIEARKHIWRELKEIRSHNHRVKYQIVYPAKLIVEGKVVRDEFPDWNEVIRSSRLSDFTHIDISDDSSMLKEHEYTTTHSKQSSSVNHTHALAGKTNMSRDYCDKYSEAMDASSSCSNDCRTSEQAKLIDLVRSTVADTSQSIRQEESTLGSVGSIRGTIGMQNTENATTNGQEGHKRSNSCTPSLFRPYNESSSLPGSDLTNPKPISNSSKKNTELPPENPDKNTHIPRSKQRVVNSRRNQSVSVPRTSQSRVTENRECDKNRQSGNKNSPATQSSSRSTCDSGISRGAINSQADS